MRSFLVVATLLSLWATRSVAEPTCAILLNDVATARKPAAFVRGLSVLPQSTRAAFPHSAATHKPTPTAAVLQRWMLATYGSVAERDAALRELQAHPDVAHVEVLRRIPLAPQASRRVVSGSRQPPWNVVQVRAPEALQQVEADSSLIVAVIDTGADLTHPDLQATLWDSGDAPGNATTADDAIDQNGDGFVETWEKHDDDNNGYVDDQHGYDFTDAPGQGGVGDATGRDADPQDDHGHGTHVAGIVAARGALTGVAPFVRLMPVRAAYSTGFGGGILETDDAAAAIVYAVDNGARVLNLSWGDTVESRLIRSAIDHAVAAGALVVAATGNDGQSGAHWPAADPRVVGVGSHQRDGTRSTFSNFGVGLDLLAPGEESTFPGSGILSLEPLLLVPEGTGMRRGTSMATPHVAGVAAILFSRADAPDMPTVRALLIDGAQRQGAHWDAARGHGRVDALSAVQATAAVLASWKGPAQPYASGRLRADGTVWGSGVQAFEVLAQHEGSGNQVVMRPRESTFWWNERLVDQTFAPTQQGIWHLVLRVEDTAGTWHEQRMRVVVDDTPAAVDSVFVQSLWHGAEARWMLSGAWDEAVAVHVVRDTTMVFSHAGLQQQHQLERRSDAALVGTWQVRFRNEAGWLDSLALVAPPAHPDWHPAALTQQSESHGFLPHTVWGVTPAGRAVVWGQAMHDGHRGNLVAQQVVDDTLQAVFDLEHRGRPVGYGDIDGDGRNDLLWQDGLRALWSTACSTCEFPDQVLHEVQTERVLGFAQLDADPALETILSSSDSLFLYDDATQGIPALLQVLVNPVQEGFVFWGADAAVGDLDADGRIELVCGDGEGNVSVFEAVPGQPFTLQQVIDTQGSYAYDLTALPDGFVVGRQRTRSVTGDGFAVTSYEFLRYAWDGNAFTHAEDWSFRAPTGDLHAGSTYVPGLAGEPPLLVLVRGADLYVLQEQAGQWQAHGWLSGADGEPPLVADLQMQGAYTWVLPTAQGARVLRVPGVRPPHTLHVESRGPGVLQLQWQAGQGDSYRVRRRFPEQTWVTLGDTSGLTWLDSTATAYTPFEYEVQMLDSLTVVGVTERRQAQSQPLPRLLDVVVHGTHALRARFSNAMQASTLTPAAFEVRAGTMSLPVFEVQRSDAGRSVQLLFADPLPCDSLQFVVGDLRDDQHGVMAADARSTRLGGVCNVTPFLVRSITPLPQGFALTFSAPPHADALVPTTYAVTWNGQPQQVQHVVQRDATQFELQMQSALVGRGIPYRVGIDASLQANDGTPLQLPQQPFEVLWQGRGAQALIVSPNPVRAGTSEVRFLEAADDTRVTLYNLEGERVVHLTEVRGGALRWDLRNASGSPVSSGTYVYVATDTSGRAVGSLVIIR